MLICSMLLFRRAFGPDAMDLDLDLDLNLGTYTGERLQVWMAKML